MTDVVESFWTLLVAIILDTFLTQTHIWIETIHRCFKISFWTTLPPQCDYQCFYFFHPNFVISVNFIEILTSWNVQHVRDCMYVHKFTNLYILNCFDTGLVIITYILLVIVKFGIIASRYHLKLVTIQISSNESEKIWRQKGKN
jgi:hypothetical protein